MMDNYLEILEDSLLQKKSLLDQIAAHSGKQEELLKQEKLSLEDFDAYVDKKDVLIQKLIKLDEGFDLLYERIKEQIQDHKDTYKGQIARLQELISQITEKSVSIQAQESRNKTMVEQHFKNLRQEMKQSRKSSKAAYGYYKSMSNTNIVGPQYMDEKN